MEGEAILSIVERIQTGKWQLVNSEAIAVELEKLQNFRKKRQIHNVLKLADFIQRIDTDVDFRTKELERFGFGLFDAFHIACAEAVQADAFLTTDDRLLKAAQRNAGSIKVSIENPVIWLMHFLQSE